MNLDSAILDAWRRIRPRLDDDPDDLARRLARRRRAVLMRPPRAWCLALRACDGRITADGEDVTLVPDDLRRLCAPVRITWPGEPLRDVARKLGTTPVGLRSARLANVFRVRHIPLLGGSRGRPVPLLYTDRPLDPAAAHFARADPAWNWTAYHLIDRIPKSLGHVTLTRVPCYRSHAPQRRYAEHVHPEAHDQDGLDVLKRRKRLPPPEPDPVWYKWSRATNGQEPHYLGDDPSNWRKGPHDFGDRPPRFLTKRKQKRRPALSERSESKGSLHFNGHHWLCPACGKKCRTIFMPLPPINLLARQQPRLAQVIDIPRRLDGFACVRCHGIQYFSRCSRRSWNHLIGYLSAGLLYGHEVARPDWLTTDRKRAFKSRPGRAPSKRRAQILRLIEVGAPNRAIARELGLSRGVVRNHIKEIYRHHGVHTRAALAAKLGCLSVQPVPRPRLGRDEILPHLLAGKSLKQIAAETGAKLASVHSAAVRAYRFHGVTTRAAFASLTHSPLPTRHSRPTPRRDEVLRRLLAGQTYKQIAAAMGITPSGVGVVANKIYRMHGVQGRRQLQVVRLSDAADAPKSDVAF